MAGPPAGEATILFDVIKLHDIIIVYIAQYVNMFLKKSVSDSVRVSKKLNE